MKNVLIAILLFIACSCKKEPKEPVYNVSIEAYCKNSNATVKTPLETKSIGKNYSNSFEVKESDLQHSITLKNNNLSQNDSLNLKVTLNGKVKQQGIKINNTYNTISIQLSSI